MPFRQLPKIALLISINLVFVFESTLSVRANSLCPTTIAKLVAQFRTFDLTKGLGARGYISYEPKNSPEARVASLAVGLNYLGIRITVMPTVEAARAHDANEADPAMKSLYIIGAPQQIGDGLSKDLYIQTFMPFLSSGVFMDLNGEWTQLPKEVVQEKLRPELWSWKFFGTKYGSGFYQSGWLFSQSHRAVLMHKDIEGRAIVRKLLRQGYWVTFNQDFLGVLKGAAAQRRAGGASTRYDEDMMRIMTSLYENNYAYSVEVWRKEWIPELGEYGDQLVGGDIGVRYGGMFKGDSVFYNDPRLGNRQLDIARMAAIALSDRLAADGIFMVDSGNNISKFSRSLGTTYVTGKTFSEHLKSIQSLPPPDLSKSWEWSEVASIQKQLADERLRAQKISEKREQLKPNPFNQLKDKLWRLAHPRR